MSTTAGNTRAEDFGVQVRSERRQAVLRSLRMRRAAAHSRQTIFLRRAALLRSVGDYVHRH